MLLLLLIFTVLIMALSMGMSFIKAKSEEKTLAGILWITLSCVSTLTVMGISYLMITAPPAAKETAVQAPAVSSQTTNAQAANAQAANAQAANAQAANTQAVNVQAANTQAANAQTLPPASAATAGVQGAGTPALAATASADKLAMDASGSYDYLIEVLETIKRGEPIPDKFLQLLPKSPR